MCKSNVTRGYGLLENLLAKKRAMIANKLIPAAIRTGRILDFGSGTFPLFLKNTIFSEKYGFDKVPQNDYNNGLQEQNIIIAHGDMKIDKSLPFDNNYFDCVTMLAVFEHIQPENLVKTLSELHRILKPGGIFILTTPTVWANYFLKFMSRLKLVSRIEIEEHKDAYTHSKIRKILKAAGFSKQKIKLGYFEMFMNIWGTALK